MVSMSEMEVAPDQDEAPEAEAPERSFVFKLNHFFVPEKYHDGMKIVVGHPIAEIFVVVVILVNTLLLVIYNPNKLQQTSASTKNALEWVDLGFTLFYTFEAVWRMMCFGLFDIGTDSTESDEDEEVMLLSAQHTPITRSCCAGQRTFRVQRNLES
eukprot:SAG31_NODE_8_length_42345_cov_10.980992_18_plen_156_part_00